MKQRVLLITVMIYILDNNNQYFTYRIINISFEYKGSLNGFLKKFEISDVEKSMFRVQETEIQLSNYGIELLSSSIPIKHISRIG